MLTHWGNTVELAHLTAGDIVMEHGRTVDSGRLIGECQTNALITGGIENSGEIRRRERDERNIVNPRNLCARTI